MTISHPEVRANIIEAIKRTNSKYAKPFERGQMASMSFAGGGWENYAQVVLLMVIADSLLAVESQLGEMNARLGAQSIP
jgi:hypothetical protein